MTSRTHKSLIHMNDRLFMTIAWTPAHNAFENQMEGVHMEPRRNTLRRRRPSARWQKVQASVPQHEIPVGALLQEWQRTLAKVEREAALYRYAEVHILAGTAALAVEELINSLTKTSGREPALQTDIT